MKYVHVFDGTEHEAAEGALNWPWIPEDRVAPAVEHHRAREAARAEVARVVAEAEAPAKAKAKAKAKAEDPDDA